MSDGLSSNTLYGLVYTLIFLDVLLFLAWAASIFYLYTECPLTLTNHAMFALYFLQTFAVINVLSGWNESYGKEPAPIYWLSASLLSFFFTLTILLAQFAPDPPALGCSQILLNQILSGIGLGISLISLAFWTVVRIMSRRVSTTTKRTKLVDISSSVLSY